jgi:amidase
MLAEVLSKPATAQAALVRAGQVSATELVEASLDAIADLNEKLNAFVLVNAEEARAQAAQIKSGDQRPLCGVPIAVKDLLALTRGMRTTMGSKAMGEFVPDFDTVIVERLKAAGCVIVGKTNTPEFGILPVTEPDRFGPSRNPWDMSRTPGGSSGGSAAAVSSRMVALAHANDGGGSIRIPAACCGLVGLKPSRGRVSAGPVQGEIAAGLVCEGTVSRTVSDTAEALEAIAGYTAGDPYWAQPPAEPYPQSVLKDPPQLRIAFTTTAPTGVPVDDECVQATHSAAALLESCGHSVSEDAPTIDADAFASNFIKIWIATCAASVRGCAALLGHEPNPDELEGLTRQMVEVSDSVKATDYLLALDGLRSASRDIVRFFSGYDLLLSPTLAKPPLEIGALLPDEGQQPIQMLQKSGEFAPFTVMANVTGQPALSLPLHQTDAGLPIGVQLVGPPAREDLLLSVAAQLESANAWQERVPQGLVAS